MAKLERKETSKYGNQHMSGISLPLVEQRKKLMQKLDRINAQIAKEERDIQTAKQDHDLEQAGEETQPLLIGDVQIQTSTDPETSPSKTDPGIDTARSGKSATTQQSSATDRRKEQIKAIADEDEAEKIRSHFEYPSELGLVVFQMCMSLGYCGYVITAWLYIGAVRHKVFPDCNTVWPFSHEMQGVCEFSILAFWTYPIFCCIFLLVFFYKDLLGTRVYYEMLCHNVYLDMENVDFMDARAVRFLMFWMVMGVLMYPATGNLHISGIKGTIAYWIPIMSFLGMLYASWDLETRLLSLAKYVEREFDDAKIHMQNSVFLRDYLARRAFERVRDASRKMQKIHTTGSYVKAIVKMAEKMCLTESEWMDDVVADEAAGYDSFWIAFSNSYWVTDFLYCPALEDARAKKFRVWMRVYIVYTWSLMLFFLYLMLCTIISHLHHQRILETSFLTEWFQVSHFLVFPVGPSHSKDVTGADKEHFLFQLSAHLHHL